MPCYSSDDTLRRLFQAGVELCHRRLIIIFIYLFSSKKRVLFFSFFFFYLGVQQNVTPVVRHENDFQLVSLYSQSTLLRYSVSVFVIPSRDVT